MKNLLLILAVTIFVNCNKVPGCTDVDAENYFFEATEDNGSCSYRGNVVFYQDAQSSDNMLNDGITYVKLYINDVFSDRMQANTRFSFIPTCDHPDAMQLGNRGMGNLKSESLRYTLKDQNDVILISGSFVVEGNTCNSVKLVYF